MPYPYARDADLIFTTETILKKSGNARESSQNERNSGWGQVSFCLKKFPRLWGQSTGLVGGITRGLISTKNGKICLLFYALFEIFPQNIILI